jgi:hypothetical protein
MATQLEKQVASVDAFREADNFDVAFWTAAVKHVPSASKEARALADLADQWLRADRQPSWDEWKSYRRRSAHLSTLMIALAEES